MSLVGEKIRRSIVYGSLATPIKKPDSDHTHKWTVYVRGFNGEDISYYVKRVSFKLHESFAQPIRSIGSLCIFQGRAHYVDLDQHPFEVNETGWGEFQIQIKIIFQDPSQRPLTINHHLRLYPPDDAGQLKTSKPVLSEFYDEIVQDTDIPSCYRAWILDF